MTSNTGLLENEIPVGATMRYHSTDWCLIMIGLHIDLGLAIPSMAYSVISMHFGCFEDALDYYGRGQGENMTINAFPDRQTKTVDMKTAERASCDSTNAVL